MVNAGRILILAKGAWNSSTNYSQLDLVSYNSIAYLARQASVGVNPSTDTQMLYWMPFGSAASIATTSTPGLVMPDGQTITVTNTGLIKAVLGINDLTDVTITSPTNGQVLKYNSSTQKWENGSLGTAAAKNSTNAVTSGSTDLVESGAVHRAIDAVSSVAYKTTDSSESAIADADYIPFYDSSAGTTKKIAVSDAKFGGGALYFTSVACAATTGNFATKSDSNITANHVVVSVEYANPSAITSDVTWTTANGSVTLNGTCASATTCSIVLVEKDN